MLNKKFHKTSLSFKQKNVKYLFYLFIFNISAVMLYPGCSDDTVSSNYNIDLPRFNWRTVNLYSNYFNQVWANDTGNIYFLSCSSSDLYKLSGNILTNYTIGNNYIQRLSGTKNEVVIFALSNTNELKFILWNGSPLEIPTGFILPDTLDPKFTGCATENMGYWICSQTGVVFYNNGNIKYYYLNEPFFNPRKIFKTNQNTIRITGESINRQIMFELQDTTFIKIFDYTGNYFLQVLNNEAIGYYISEHMTGPCFYTLSGNNFIENYCINTNIPISFGLYFFSGSSFSDIFFPVYSTALFNELSSTGILHWNGYKFSKEFEFEAREPGIGFGVLNNYSIDENNFLILEGYYPKITLYIGTRKK